MRMFHNLLDSQSESLVDLSKGGRESIGGQSNGGMGPLSPSMRARGFNRDDRNSVRKDLHGKSDTGVDQDRSENLALVLNRLSLKQFPARHGDNSTVSSIEYTRKN